MTEDAVIGRVSSVLTLGSLGLAPLAYGPFGLLADATTPAVAFWICAALAAAVAVAAAVALTTPTPARGVAGSGRSE
ncbi:hypothetical protein GCM10009785_03070 [Brooklawnia cerclae]|uniref:MFS transporter n=1 Tax=Brooklawnia cerclae TaxID=349934 RepID=A0ABX0SCH7_9ACTN|nr:hypothetical protein [Brooklawnia cerclae]